MSACANCAALPQGVYCSDCLMSGNWRHRATENPEGPREVDVETIGKKLRAHGTAVAKRQLKMHRLAAGIDTGEGFKFSSGKRDTAKSTAFHTLGAQSSFYNPAHTLATAIEKALDPNEPPPRKFVRKKRKPKFRLSEDGRLFDSNGEPFRIFVEGKLMTYRYRGWTVDAVAEVNAEFLRGLSGLPSTTDEDRNQIRRALIRAAARKRGLMHGTKAPF